MYVQRNTEAPSCNNCWTRKTIIFHILKCICRRSYPACNEHAPYCYLWPARLYNIFPHYLTNGTIFGKPLLNTICVFWFYLQILSTTFLILRRTERHMTKKYIWFSHEVSLFLSDFNETWIFSTHFRKNTQISLNPSSRRRVFLCRQTDGWTDRHDEANGSFLQFCEST